MLWQVITTANVAIAAAYFGITWIIFLSLRGSYASVLRGAQMFEDFKVRERQALEINDNIVQGLAVARMALEKGDDKDTRVAIEDTLRRSQALISELLGSDETEKIGPGDLRRSQAAGVSLRGDG